jgi:transposase
MNQWETIRLRCLRDQEPIARVARELGVSENTVRKYIRTDSPPTKMRIQRDAVLDPYQPIIDDYLKSVPKITSRRIGTLLRERHGFHGQLGARMSRRFLAKRREGICPKEVFILAGIETVVQLFDNAKTAVDRVLAGTERIEHTEFQAYRGTLAFEVHFAATSQRQRKEWG